MVILSIDPGFEKVGYALFEKKETGRNSFQYLTSGLIKTARDTELDSRLKAIYDDVSELIHIHKPSLMVIERLFFFKNQKTVIGVSQAQGVIMLSAAQNNIPTQFLTPLQIKEIVTGYGNADKQSVRKMLTLLLKDKIPVCEDDQSDAIACGLAYCYMNPQLM